MCFAWKLNIDLVIHHSTSKLEESLHHRLNKVSQFPRRVFISCVSKAVWSQAGFTLKLMHYEPNDYNNDEQERLREHIECCQKFLELGGSMVDVICMDEVGFNLHLTCHFWRACQGQRYQRIHPTQRCWSLSFDGHSWSWRSHSTRCHTWCPQYIQVFRIHSSPCHS